MEKKPNNSLILLFILIAKLHIKWIVTECLYFYRRNIYQDMSLSCFHLSWFVYLVYTNAYTHWKENYNWVKHMLLLRNYVILEYQYCWFRMILGIFTSLLYDGQWFHVNFMQPLFFIIFWHDQVYILYCFYDMVNFYRQQAFYSKTSIT